jgi:hypothetical protein
MKERLSGLHDLKKREVRLAPKMAGWFACFLLLIPTASAASSFAGESTMEFGPFGTIHLYSQAHRPSQVALFVG